MKGVVDSEDLPLNISREMLQNNPQVAQIRKAVTGCVLAELETLAEKDQETFQKIWDAFGPVLKEGLYEDFERRDQLLGLARFTTTTGASRSLKQYMADLRPNQTDIYYLTGESAERVKSNPKLEAARARGRLRSVGIRLGQPRSAGSSAQAQGQADGDNCDAGPD